MIAYHITRICLNKNPNKTNPQAFCKANGIKQNKQNQGGKNQMGLHGGASFGQHDAQLLECSDGFGGFLPCL